MGSPANAHRLEAGRWGCRGASGRGWDCGEQAAEDKGLGAAVKGRGLGLAHKEPHVQGGKTLGGQGHTRSVDTTVWPAAVQSPGEVWLADN